MAKILTSASIKAFRPGPTRREIKDGGSQGLYLIIQESGHKSFALRFRNVSGRPSKLVLGPFDPGSEAEGEPVISGPLTLSAARRLAAELNRERARGKDLITDHQQRKTKLRVQSTNTFAKAARDFVEDHAAKTRSAAKTAKLLGLTLDGETIPGGLCDRWVDRDLASISANDVYLAVEEVRRNGLFGLAAKTAVSDSRARHFYSALSVMFGWACRNRRMEQQNPCLSVHKPKGGRSRDKVLSPEELKRVWQAASSGPFSALVRFLILNGCRLNEAAQATWAEISDEGVWVLPSERSKNHRSLTTPLSTCSLALLDAQPKLGPYVFTTTGDKGYAGFSRAKRRLDAKSEVQNWRLHDIRRSVATHLAETGIAAPHVIEKILNHSPGGVAAVYNRSQLLAERRDALEKWGSYLQGLVEDRVVPLRQRA